MHRMFRKVLLESRVLHRLVRWTLELVANLLSLWVKASVLELARGVVFQERALRSRFGERERVHLESIATNKEKGDEDCQKH